jgi:bifunctional NMN adenylyltransferase/nudix hydrolase
MYDVANFIGRLRPVTNAHIEIIRIAMEEARYVHVNVGSCFQPRTERSPFTYDEVVSMVRGAFAPNEQERILFSPVMDSPYNNTKWQTNVRNAMQSALTTVDVNPSNAKIALVGHRKDFGTSFYLDMFPEWGSIGVDNLFENLSATTMRDHLFENHGWDDTYRDFVPASTNAFLRDFVRTDACQQLFAEVDYYRDYRNAHAEAEELIAKKLKYKTKIKHQTVDSLVVQSGHVLLIERKNLPGRNLWAIPGGFLDDGEWLEDAMLRELKEETRIAIPPAVLRGGIRAKMRADYPYRSARGRVISEVFLIKLEDGPLPKVKGRSDAKVAKWVPISEIRPENMFEDHFFVIEHLLNQLDKA